MAVRIPQKYRSGVKLLSTIDAFAYAMLEKSLEERRPLYHEPAKIPTDIEVVGLEPAQVMDILESVASLHGIKYLSGWSNEEVADEISDFVRTAPEFGDVPAENKQSLKERLTKLLRIGGVLEFIAKSKGLLSSHQRVYNQSRIITDIRPVFLADVTKEPSAAILVHTLQIEYYESGEHSSFFIAMDSDDLKELQDTIKRAQDKEDTLRKVVIKLGSIS